MILVLFVAIAMPAATCPVRPMCPTHNVEMDEYGKDCQDTGWCTITYRCPVGGEERTVKCRGGE